MIVPLSNPQHTRIVLALLLQSTLDYGEQDARLAAWEQGEGRWAVAVSERGMVQGIAVLVPLDDVGRDGLLWLEVLPRYQRQGIGRALVQWAQAQSGGPLEVRPVRSAAAFYNRCGLAAA